MGSRYYDPEVGRWINADSEDVLFVGHENFIQYNLFAYCFNNPVNLSDENGTWPKWATKVIIGTAAIAVGVAATVITGGSALPAVVGSLKLAVSGAVIGTSVAATKHIIKKGTIEGIGDEILDGAATGYMVGIFIFEILGIFCALIYFRRILLLPIDVIYGKVTCYAYTEILFLVKDFEFDRSKHCCEWKFLCGNNQRIYLLDPTPFPLEKIHVMEHSKSNVKLKITYYRFSRLLLSKEPVDQ